MMKTKKDMMKTKTVKLLFTLVLTMLLCPSVMMAQPDNNGRKRAMPIQNAQRMRFSPEEYMQKEKEFMTREAGLSQREAADYFPLYHKMKDEQRKLSFRMAELMRKAERENLNDAESLKLLNELIDKEEQIADLEEKYHKKFLKIVPARKLLKLRIASKQFERKALFETFRRPHHNGAAGSRNGRGN